MQLYVCVCGGDMTTFAFLGMDLTFFETDLSLSWNKLVILGSLASVL